MDAPLTVHWTVAFDEPDEDGWIVARVVDKPGAMSQGRTRQEALDNVRDALRELLAYEDERHAQEPRDEAFASLDAQIVL